VRRACVAFAAVVLAHAAVVSAGPDEIDGVVVDHGSGQPIAGATLAGERAGIVASQDDGTFFLDGEKRSYRRIMKDKIPRHVRR